MGQMQLQVALVSSVPHIQLNASGVRRVHNSAPILGSTFSQASLSASGIFEFSARPLQAVRTMDTIARPAKVCPSSPSVKEG